MCLAAGRAESLWAGAPCGHRIGMIDLDFRPGGAFPRAVAQLGEPGIVAPLGRIEAERAPDDQCRLAGSAQGASQEDRWAWLARQFDAEGPAHGGCLLATA